MKRISTFRPEERKQRKMHFVYPKPGQRTYHYTESGFAAIQAMESGLIHERSVEAARKAVRRAVKKMAKLRFCLNPFLAITEKPSEVRMGKGKGKVEYHVYPVAKGKILFELAGIPWYKGKAALKRSQVKLPLKTKIVVLRDWT